MRTKIDKRRVIGLTLLGGVFINVGVACVVGYQYLFQTPLITDFNVIVLVGLAEVVLLTGHVMEHYQEKNEALNTRVIRKPISQKSPKETDRLEQKPSFEQEVEKENVSSKVSSSTQSKQALSFKATSQPGVTKSKERVKTLEMDNNPYSVLCESNNKKVATKPVSTKRNFSSSAPKPQPSTQKVILTEEKVEQPKQRDFKHNNRAQGQSQAKVNNRLKDKPSIPQGKTKKPEDKKVTSKEVSVSPQKISTPQPLGSRPTPRVWGHIAKKDGIYSAKGLYTGPSTPSAEQAVNNINTFNTLNKA